MAERKPTILVVNDTEENVDILVELLSDDYDVHVAIDGESALRSVANYPPALILLDIMMPGIDGYEVCRRLKADPKTRPIPVILVTAMSAMEDERQGLALGAVDYIAKPISPPIMLTRVKNHLELARAKAQTAEANPDQGEFLGYERRCGVRDRRKYAAARRPPRPQERGQGDAPPSWLPGLDISGGIKRFQGNREFYLKLLKQFAEDNEGILAAILEARRLGDLETASRLLHTVKSSAANINALRLRQAAAELEKASQGDEAALPDFYENFRQSLAEVTSSIRHLQTPWKSPEPEKEVTPGKRQEIQAFLGELSEFLQRHDFKVLQLWQGKKHMLTHGGDSAEVAGLEKSIERFDFSGALWIINNRFSEPRPGQE